MFIEAPETPEELGRVGSEFRHVPQLANMLESGRTPWLLPDELFRMGFAMVAYPTSLIFRVTRTIETALAALKAGRLEQAADAVSFEAFKSVVDFAPWLDIDERFED